MTPPPRHRQEPASVPIELVTHGKTSLSRRSHLLQAALAGVYAGVHPLGGLFFR